MLESRRTYEDDESSWNRGVRIDGRLCDRAATVRHDCPSGFLRRFRRKQGSIGARDESHGGNAGKRAEPCGSGSVAWLRASFLIRCGVSERRCAEWNEALATGSRRNGAGGAAGTEQRRRPDSARGDVDNILAPYTTGDRKTG